MGHKKKGSPSSPCVAVDGFQPIKSLASPPSLPKISIKIVEPILGTTTATHHWTQSTGQNNGKLDQFLLSQKNTFQLLSQHKSDFRIIVENVNEQPNLYFFLKLETVNFFSLFSICVVLSWLASEPI